MELPDPEVRVEFKLMVLKLCMLAMYLYLEKSDPESIMKNLILFSERKVQRVNSSEC